jgi:hypothetical protein
MEAEKEVDVIATRVRGNLADALCEIIALNRKLSPSRQHPSNS